MELPIDDYIIKSVEEQEKKGKIYTLYQYPIFEWKPGIPIMNNTTESEDKNLNEENA